MSKFENRLIRLGYGPECSLTIGVRLRQVIELGMLIVCYVRWTLCYGMQCNQEHMWKIHVLQG